MIVKDLIKKPVAKKRFMMALFVFSLTLFGINIVSKAPKVNAAYEGGNLIDDSVFLNAGSMTKTDIQSFLAGKNAGLANLSFVLDCDIAGTQAKQIYLSIGAPCGQSTPASHIIYYSAQIYGINPQVILATMQKEQSLTTAANPTSWQLNQAMGYNCPTSGGCNASTFFYQIDNGTWVLRFHYERARGNMNWWYTSASWTCGTEKAYYKPNLYPGKNVDFFDQDGKYYRTHYISNAATSAFYCYTPHAFNNHRNGVPAQSVPAGTLCYSVHPEYGSTGRCYTGSYNFVKFFELWFGSVRANDTDKAHPNGSFVTDTTDQGKIYLIEDGQKRFVTSPYVFNSYKFPWGKIKKATTGDRNLPLGTPVNTLAPGTVFTTSSSPAVYVMDYDVDNVLKKRAITAYAFRELGYTDRDVMIVPTSEVPAPTFSTVLDTPRHPSGTQLIFYGIPAVFMVDKGKLRPIANELAFDSNFLRMADNKGGTQFDSWLPKGELLQARAGTIIHDQSGIIVVDYDGSGIMSRPFGPWDCYSNRMYYSSNDWIRDYRSFQAPARRGPIFTC